MNIKRAKSEIKDTVAAYLLKDGHDEYLIPSVRQRPVLLIGPPGVGKTQIMEQVARECGIGLVAYTITHHTRQSAIGLPFIIEKQYGGKLYKVTEYTMSEIVASIYDKIEDSGLAEGLLFIDEINCVSETLAPAMLQFLQYKSFGNHKIPDGWIIAAAGNPPEFNKSVRDFDVVTLDRMKMIQIEPDYEVWKEYAYQQSVHPAVISYLNTRKDSFCRIETKVDGKWFATPRGWEDLSSMILVYEKLGMKIDREVISQYIQYPPIAKDFANYLELYEKYNEDCKLDEIFSGAISESLCRKLSRAPFDEKLNVVGLLLAKLTSKFKEALGHQAMTAQLMEVLQTVAPAAEKAEGGKAETSTAETIIAKQTGENGVLLRFRSARVSFEAEWKKKLKAGLLSRQEDYRNRDMAALLELMEKTVKDQNFTQEEEEKAWELIRQHFKEENNRYEALMEEGEAYLERAFDLMEAAFGDSQEMVVFITELNTSHYCARFLQECDCERYYLYNKRLLFRGEEDRLKSRIDSLGK